MITPVCQRCRHPAMPASAENAEPFPERCAHCGAFFQIEVFPAAWHSSQVARTPDPRSEDDSACFHHPAHRAADCCSRCGRFLCTLCCIDFRGNTLCGDCVEAIRTANVLEHQAGSIRYDRLFEIILLYGTLPVVTAGPTALFCIIGCLIFWNKRGMPPARYSPMWRPLLVALLLLILYISGIAILISDFF